MRYTEFFASTSLPIVPSSSYLLSSHSPPELRSSPPFRFQPSSSFLPFIFSELSFFIFFHFSPHFLALLFQYCFPFSVLAFNIRKEWIRQILQKGSNKRQLCSSWLPFRISLQDDLHVLYLFSIFFFLEEVTNFFYFLFVMKNFLFILSRHYKIFLGSLNDPQAVPDYLLRWFKAWLFIMALLILTEWLIVRSFN